MQRAIAAIALILLCCAASAPEEPPQDARALEARALRVSELHLRQEISGFSEPRLASTLLRLSFSSLWVSSSG